MSTIFNWLIKSSYVQAQILAIARHIVTAAGAALVMHGLANNSMVQDLAGLVAASISFYLSQVDVKNVDGKITIALNTPSPVQSAASEVTETKELNSEQNNK